MDYEIKHAIEHLAETNGIRRTFWRMDEKVEGLLFGIRQGDDAVVVGDTVVNMEGPYPMKIARKTGLIHTCSDIVVMGARPLFALNAMQVDSLKQAEEIAADLKKQSDGLGVPIVGGNTQLENNLVPCASFVVIGKLVKKPIADAGAIAGDKILMLGEVVEGEIGERVYRAKVKYATFLELVEKGVKIHASKDASRGGWFGNLTEILVKSKVGVNITSIQYPNITRYMGTYMISVPEGEVPKILRVATKHKCPVVEMGTVTEKFNISIGGRVVVTKAQMDKIVKNMPFRKAKV